MTPTDWEQRYQTGDMPWEKGEPAPGLIDFLAEHPQLPRGTVAIPGCDLAPSAIRHCCEKTAAAGLKADFAQADFLETTPPNPFDWLFEHTLFCAIQPARRDDYVKAVLRWLRPTGQFLAVHYMIRDEQGPPFGVGQQELMERFLPHFELVRGWVPRSYPNRTGLELMLWWRRKAA
jgi:methyl halide transferase